MKILHSLAAGLLAATSILVRRVAFPLFFLSAGLVFVGPSPCHADVFTNTGSMATAREEHTATLLPNGKVLVAGGFDNGSNPLASAELYNPTTGAWTTTGNLNTARANHTATLLLNGSVLVAGGGNTFVSAELYDPVSGTWTTTGNLNALGHALHTATLLANGKVLVAGGIGSASASAELYDPAHGSWTVTGNLITGRNSHTATLLPNGKVLVTAGFGGANNMPLASAELYDPATGTWTAIANLSTARYLHTATLLANGKVLVAGGANTSGGLASAELYDPTSDTWAVTGNLNTARPHHTATLLPSDKVLVAGGVASAELYDPASGTWTATGSLNTVRGYHTANLLPNGKVLVAGGAGSNGTVLTSAELYGPARPAITSPATATATQDELFVYQITATATPTSYTATPLPAGLSFDSVSGILGGYPTNSGTTQIHLTASNSIGTGMKVLTLTVQPLPGSGPVVMSGTSITARTGQPFSFEVFTTGANATARLSATGLPPGLSADPAIGVISGTPTVDGSFGVTLTVTEGPVTFISTLQLTFTSDPAIPVITNPREVTLTVGQFFTYTINAPSSDHSGTSFSLIGNLPLGLGFDATTGTISGTFNPGDQNGGALLGNVQTNTHNSSGSGTNPLSFFQAVPATAVNISTRLAVGTNDDVLIGGFIVTGNAPKKVIVLAIGPELTADHVPGALQDPMLELHNGTGALIARNDDWHTTQIGGLITSNQSAAIQASGLAPTDHRESAMIVTLAQHTGGPTSLTGNYTAIVRGKNGTTGVALVEAYDLGTASLDTSSNAQLANISTRGMVQTGDNVMIGGFIVRGDMSPTVIVRAIGPSLAQHGISNPLQDPTLELHDHNGTLIAFNDNWMSAPNRQAIIDSGLAPSNNLESAILRSLSPGNYTAIVRGKNATSGIALVEAYVLP